MTRPTTLLLCCASLALSGCLGGPPDRVQIRRDPKLVEEELDVRRKDYWELVQERQAREAKLRLTPDLLRSEARWQRQRQQTEEVLRTIPRDPWVSYEADRKRTLYRPWADVHAKAPPAPPPEEAPAAAEGEPEDAEPEAAEPKDEWGEAEDDW